jgi:hypothetical protein
LSSTFFGEVAAAEFVGILCLSNIETAHCFLSVVEFCVLFKENISDFLDVSELSRGCVAALTGRKVGIGMMGPKGVSISVELSLEEGTIRIGGVDFWVEENVQRGRSIFSSSTSSMLGARLMSPFRFLLILDGGMRSAKEIADFSC